MAGRRRLSMTNIDDEIANTKAYLKELAEKKELMENQDNIRLGKLVKKVFGDWLPEEHKDQERFLNELAGMAAPVSAGNAGIESAVQPAVTAGGILQEQAVMDDAGTAPPSAAE